MEVNIKELVEKLKKIGLDDKIENPENENILYLAYIGDAIYEVFTRDYLIKRHIKTLKMEELHKKNVELVCAKSEARVIEKLIDDNLLNDDEIKFYKHARNAHSNTKSKNSSIVDYRKATGLEALLGLLFYKSDIDRLVAILNIITQIFDER